MFNENRKQDRDLAVAVVAPDAGLAAQLDPTSSEPTPAPPAAASPAPVTAAVAAPVAAAAAPATDAVPAPPHGDAVWDRWAPAVVGTNAPCVTPLAPVGAQVTVTHLDNGRRVTCLVIEQVALPSGVVVKLDAGLFQALADLGESPIPVRLTT